ncbi:uncharacterized protein LOC129597225 [Paramacrobiotus metropolitanus]|uniref:uncharacterized protein LOC129597225 n=1 Tax=Paramacrobiotus metropolitanus TaxID=2943436 RepID=UPI002445C52C|nr:uncharacterized protein LOC129597225 [Paramacrobiotus metropolitanus]XP_055350669.1 uncharacterized protein LOC129597225 [Paramacrobiotus metropolitanus]
MLYSVSRLLTFGALLSVVHGAGYGVPRARRWPRNPNAAMDNNGYTDPLVKIPYDVPDDYTIPQYTIFQNAITKIYEATNKCIRFVPWSALYTDVLHVTYYINSTTQSVSPVCRGPLGYTAGSQTLLMVSNGRTGCLDPVDGERDVTRMLLNVLGVVSEYQRPDRDDVAKSPMQFLSGYNDKVLDVLQADGIFNIKTDTIPLYPDEFDMDSVTMVRTARYAKDPSIPVFTRTDGKDAPTSATLSQKDCEALNYMYQCNIVCASTSGDLGLPKFNKDEISESYFCWETTTASVNDADVFEDTISIVEDSNPISATSISYEFTPAIGVTATSPNSATPKTAQLKLKNSIIKGFKSSVRLTAKTGSTPVAADDIEVSVNCWPRFQLAGAGELPCGTPGKRGKAAADFIVERECARSGATTYTRSGLHCNPSGGDNFIAEFRNIITISINDPDGTTPEFLGLRVHRDGNPGNDFSSSWKYVETSKSLMVTASNFEPGNYAFQLLFVDPDAAGLPIAFTFAATLKCKV